MSLALSTSTPAASSMPGPIIMSTLAPSKPTPAASATFVPTPGDTTPAATTPGTTPATSRQQELLKLGLKELKAMAGAAGTPVTGTKLILVQRICDPAAHQRKKAKPGLGIKKAPKKKEKTISPALSAQLSMISEKLFDENGCFPFSFGYINTEMTNPGALAAAGIVIAPGQEPCVPVPKAWSIVEPLQELLFKNRELMVLFKSGFFASAFKLYTKAQPSQYFFGGQVQVETEFSRHIAEGASVLDLLDALHGIFADAKCHPCETMMIFGFEPREDGVYVEWGR